MAGWHHWLDGRESEWSPGVGDGQGGLACCNSWGRRVGHDWVTELNWKNDYSKIVEYKVNIYKSVTFVYNSNEQGKSENKNSIILKLALPNVIRSDQSLSRVWLFVTPWITACQASLSITNSQSSLRLTSIKSVIPSSHLILCHPLLLLPPIPPSIRVFSNDSTLCMRWPKSWSFSFSIISSKEIPGLISFRMDWLDLLAVQM